MSFNLNEEVIDGYLVSAETKKLWAVEMDLAKHLLEVCEKHNLKIWAIDGTLLGAVRHKGFIPWDDDMDFGMMREDYDKLIEIGPSEFKEPYFFQSFYTDEHSWGGIAKLRRSNTAIIERGYQIRKDFNRGIFVDIVVMDAIPNDIAKFKKLNKKVVFLRQLLKNYEMINPKRCSFISKIKHAIISVIVKIYNPKKMHERIEKMLASNSLSENENCGLLDFYALEGRDATKKPLRNKHLFEETILLPFHDMLLPAPAGYDTLLRAIYGDYMKPVKGTQSHGNIIIDTERSYIEVMDDLKKQFNNL